MSCLFFMPKQMISSNSNLTKVVTLICFLLASAIQVIIPVSYILVVGGAILQYPTYQDIFKSFKNIKT